jgi:glycosyltransferase involved in cell wall biosynthesis
VVLAVGRLAAQKGYGTLLAAAARWQRRDPAPLLVIAGAGPLADGLHSQARSAGLAVRFLGQRRDIPALLACADVVVLASSWEGQPLIVQEALRAGRPLVATRVGGVPDLTGQDGAVLVPAGDPGRLAAAVLSVLDDPGRGEQLSVAALARAATLPDETAAVDAVMAIYQQIAALRRCAPR